MHEAHDDASNIKSMRRTRHSNVEDLVERLAHVHARLAQHYGVVAQTAEDERTRLILNVLVEGENDMERSLHDFKREMRESIGKREYKYVPDLNEDDLLHHLETRHPANADELAEYVNDVHRAIDGIYESLDANALPEELQEVIESLREQELQHVKEQVRATRGE